MIEFKSNIHSGPQLIVDGVEMRNVIGLCFECDVGEVPVLTIKLFAPATHLELAENSTVRVQSDEPFKNYIEINSFHDLEHHSRRFVQGPKVPEERTGCNGCKLLNSAAGPSSRAEGAGLVTPPTASLCWSYQ